VLRRLLLALTVGLACQGAQAQERPADAGAAPDSLAADSLAVAPADTTVRALPAGLRLAPPAPDGLEAPITYTATDSVRIVLAPRRGAGATEPPDDLITLYGDTEATYETATIAAAVLQYRSAREELRAEPRETPDGPAGLPRFAQGDESFTGRLFVYNLASRRGRVTQARTQIEDGYLLGGIIKQHDAHVIFAENAAYTTCELDHPHYALEAGRLKIVDGKEVYTGPVRLRLLGLPTPLMLPFGYFPAAEGRRSGPLPVRYGSESGYGLFLENVGWYWALSDYLDAQVSGKLGTEGSFQVRGAARYKRLYAYDGQFDISAGRLRTGESTDPGFAPRVPLQVRWSHAQTFPTGQQLQANVDLQSTSQRLVADAVSQQVQQSTSSAVTFSQSWPRVGRSFSANLRASQNLRTEQATLTLPSVQFNQQRVFPLRRGRDDRWYESIGVSYSASATNTYDFRPTATGGGISFVDGLLRPGAYLAATGDSSRFAYRVEQRVPVQASFSVPGANLSIVPSLSFTELWAGEAEERVFLADSNRVETRQVAGFASARRVAATLSLSTELFGTFPVRVGPLDGLRHTLRPRAALSFEPDYAALGFVREVRADTASDRTVRYARIAGIPTSPTQSLSFGIENAFLARLARTDSTGEVQRRTVQLLSVSVQGGYNLAALERPFADLQTSFNSQLGGVTASGNASFSAYALDDAGALTDRPLLDGGWPLRLTAAGVRLGRSFRSREGRAADVRPVVAPRTAADAYDPTRVTQSAVVGYVDYAAPWSFALDLTLSRQAARGPVPAQTTATLAVNQFNVRLTPTWSATGSTGLDLTTGEPTLTRIGLTRDLHCWEMQVNWQPIGAYRGFSFSLFVKSGHLRDLLRLDVPRTVSRSLPF
jgi:hypothetical protein